MKNPKINCPYCFKQLKKSTHYNHKYYCSCSNKYTLYFDFNGNIFDENFVVGNFWVKNRLSENIAYIFKHHGQPLTMVEPKHIYKTYPGTFTISSKKINENFVLETKGRVPFLHTAEEMENIMLL